MEENGFSLTLNRIKHSSSMVKDVFRSKPNTLTAFSFGRLVRFLGNEKNILEQVTTRIVSNFRRVMSVNK